MMTFKITWPIRSWVGIALVGDGAHIMSPFGGEGVDVAMRDAAELARHLITISAWPDAVRRFEADMFALVVEPTTHAAEAAATALSRVGQELTLEHRRVQAPGGT
jgi:2-polyprenyl-6-methoxyphenol hydroxylase-like FAD-dependent oxidoreductase